VFLSARLWGFPPARIPASILAMKPAFPQQRTTIFAPATTPGKSGIAIVRVSGPGAKSAIEALTASACPPPRYAALRKIMVPKTNDVIDKGLVLFFPAPHSFTGEDIAEFHLHGSRAILNLMLATLAKFDGFRPAEAGEFSRRAFENGQMDLTQIEGLADLIDAETALQQKQAMRQMEGELGKLYNGWRDQLLGIMALIEAYIDFPDEDLPESLKEEFVASVSFLMKALEVHMKDTRGETLRAGVVITILGAPNSGKSTLLNWLAKRDVAIVSHIAGTTRDVIEVQMDLVGFPVTLCDTAGLRETDDVIESEGIRRAIEKSTHADINLVLFDAATYPNKLDATSLGLLNSNSIVLLTKADMATLPTGRATVGGHKALTVSVTSGLGLGAIISAITTKLGELYSPGAEPSLTRERHRQLIAECHENLRRFVYSIQSQYPAELSAEEARSAVQSLGKITGKIDIEEILDAIFSKFCIGK
jgi:tRNA modification GTPase